MIVSECNGNEWKSIVNIKPEERQKHSKIITQDTEKYVPDFPDPNAPSKAILHSGASFELLLLLKNCFLVLIVNALFRQSVTRKYGRKVKSHKNNNQVMKIWR